MPALLYYAVCTVALLQQGEEREHGEMYSGEEGLVWFVVTREAKWLCLQSLAASSRTVRQLAGRSSCRHRQLMLSGACSRTRAESIKKETQVELEAVQANKRCDLMKKMSDGERCLQRSDPHLHQAGIEALEMSSPNLPDIASHRGGNAFTVIASSHIE